MNAARTELDEKEHIQGLQPDGFQSEEICGQDLIFVVSHQMTPADGATSH